MQHFKCRGGSDLKRPQHRKTATKLRPAWAHTGSLLQEQGSPDRAGELLPGSAGKAAEARGNHAHFANATSQLCGEALGCFRECRMTQGRVSAWRNLRRTPSVAPSAHAESSKLNRPRSSPHLDQRSSHIHRSNLTGESRGKCVRGEEVKQRVSITRDVTD